MKPRTVTALAAAVAALAVLQSPSALAGPAAAGAAPTTASPAGTAGWSDAHHFIGTERPVYETLRAEAARNGRAIVTFSKIEIDRPCGDSVTRVLEPRSGRWQVRTKVAALNTPQVHLVAGNRLAWLGVGCTTGVELRYSSRGDWDQPAVLEGASSSTLRAGMNAAGLVALSRASGSSILTSTARPDEDWSAVPTISTDGPPVVDHVAVTDDEQILVVWHVGDRMEISTFAAGGWTTVTVPGRVPVYRVSVGSNRTGHITIARVDDALGRVFMSSRAPDGSISQPYELDASLPCYYGPCAVVEVLPSGDAAVAWKADDQLHLGRRDVESGVWERETAGGFRPDSVRFDAHDDGTLVMVDEWGYGVWRCAWTERCSRVGYPPSTNHGAFAALPSGSVVGISGDSACDDWCDFQTVAGFVYGPDDLAAGRPG